MGAIGNAGNEDRLLLLPVDMLLSNGPVGGIVFETEIHPKLW